MSYKKSLFIFRRDLRLDDNTALIEALKNSDEVYPVFIFDNKQIGDKNEYKSNNAVQFMINSLIELEVELKKLKREINIFKGDTIKILKEIIKNENIECIYLNKDYTPFSKVRDKLIGEICEQLKIKLHTFDDYLLNPPELIKNKQGKAYRVFTAYFNAVSTIKPKPPIRNTFNNYSKNKINLKQENLKLILKKININKNIKIKGGRIEGQTLLSNLKSFKSYANTRNTPSIDTTLISAHNKFGTISIREVYQAIIENLGENSHIIRQLYWRDFFTQIAFNNERIFNEPFNKKFTNITWQTGEQFEKFFKHWKAGKTGYPIIDAGMRELNTTGFMHNRVRMIVASFLVKDLHINWKEGEKYFAQNLVDYDPAVNNGNWQWCAGTGCDAQPFFRIFNPWTQQEKFDPESKYIKKWVKELSTIDPKIINDETKIEKYYLPKVVDHKIESAKAKAYYNAIKSN